jgi:hypothetical protein
MSGREMKTETEAGRHREKRERAKQREQAEKIKVFGFY